MKTGIKPMVFIGICCIVLPFYFCVAPPDPRENVNMVGIEYLSQDSVAYIGETFCLSFVVSAVRVTDGVIVAWDDRSVDSVHVDKSQQMHDTVMVCHTFGEAKESRHLITTRVERNDGKYVEKTYPVFVKERPDTSAPVIALVSHQGGETVNNDSILVQVTATDKGNVTLVTINGDTAEYANGKYNRIVKLQTGRNTLAVVAVDTKGNIGGKQFTLIYDPDAEDVKAPVIDLISHYDGQVVVNKDIPVMVEATDENMISGVTINSSPMILQNGKYHCTISLHEGANELVVSATDNSNRKNADTITFTLVYDPTAKDTTVPRITVITPVSGQSVTEAAVDVRVEAIDENGIGSVYIENAATERNGNTFSRTVTLAEGENAITITARDASPAHNETVATIQVYYDTPPSAVTLSAPSRITYNSVQISWTQATATDFTAYKVFYSLDSNVTQTDQLSQVITNPVVTMHTIDDLIADTTYYIRVFAYKNSLSTGSNEIKVKTKPVEGPQITILTPDLKGDSVVMEETQPRITFAVQTQAPLASGGLRVTCENKSVEVVEGSIDWRIRPLLTPAIWNTVTVSATDTDGNSSRYTFYLFCRDGLNAPERPSFGDRLCAGLEVIWKNETHCNYYIVYRSESGPDGLYVPVISNKLGTMFEDTGLAVNTSYWYKLRGYYIKDMGSFNVSDTTPFSPVSECKTASCFQTVSDVGDDECGYDIVQTADSNFVIVGSRDLDEAGVLVKFDRDGKEIWKKVYNNFVGHSIVSISDGFAMAGINKSNNFAILRTDERGNYFSKGDYSGRLSSYTELMTNSMSITSDNGFIIAGQNGSSENTNIYVVKTNHLGAKQWEKTFGGSVNEYATSIITTKDGGYAVAGHVSDNLFLLKLDNYGDSLWMKTYESVGGGNSLVQAEDGSVYIVGAKNDNVFLIKIDQMGNETWNKIFSGLRSEKSYAIIQTTDSDLVFCGYSKNDGAIDLGLLIAKVDLSGNLIWKKVVYGHGEDNASYILTYSLTQTYDNGFAIAGYTESYAPERPDIYIAKTDCRGNTIEFPKR